MKPTNRCKPIGLDCSTVLIGLGSMNTLNMELVSKFHLILNKICKLKSSLKKSQLLSMLLSRTLLSNKSSKKGKAISILFSVVRTNRD